MPRDVISAKLDIIFKKIFTENNDLLRDLISSLLDIPLEQITDITIINPEMPPEIPEGKVCRLDLSLKLNDKLINIEIQVKNEPDFRDRALLYWSRLYSSELKSGDPYGILKQTITINIINFNMFDNPSYHNEIVTVIKDTGEIFSDKFSMHFFELKKIGKKLNKNNRRELWLQFINADKEAEFEMLKDTNVPIMEKAVKVIYDMSSDTRIREMARIREKALHDEASMIYNAKKEGKMELQAESFQRMKAAGIPEEDIKRYLGM